MEFVFVFDGIPEMPDATKHFRGKYLQYDVRSIEQYLRYACDSKANGLPVYFGPSTKTVTVLCVTKKQESKKNNNKKK